MAHVVTLDGDVDFAPQSEVEEIIQNVRTILKTHIGTVPLDRDFGISWAYVDQPIPVARALVQEAVIDAITEFEPRADVVSVTFNENLEDTIDGVLKPIVTISIKGEVSND